MGPCNCIARARPETYLPKGMAAISMEIHFVPGGTGKALPAAMSPTVQAVLTTAEIPSTCVFVAILENGMILVELASSRSFVPVNVPIRRKDGGGWNNAQGLLGHLARESSVMHTCRRRCN